MSCLLADTSTPQFTGVHVNTDSVGVYTPSRILQGSTDAGNHFQSVTSCIFAEINKILQWLDDFLLHAKDEQELLKNLERFLYLCDKFGLKINAKKFQLFLKSAEFCGRIIDKDGTRFQPRQLEALLNMRTPEFAADLQQFMCASNWMRSSIPAYSNTVAPLHTLLEACYNKAGKRTKQSIKKISLTGLWGRDHETSFRTVQNQIAQSTRLAHRKDTNSMSLFTDASETH